MRPILAAVELSVRFGGLRAVDMLDLELHEAEILGLIGPNGAGKTTLFNVISGMLAPSAGRVILRGMDITGLPPERISAIGVARTFQNVRPFVELSVRENVMMGAYGSGFCGVFASAFRLSRHARLERDAADHSAHWLERLGLTAYADLPAAALPLGLQRIAELARAMAADPVVLLLDEPAAGLNGVEKRRLARLLRVINAETGCALLLIDHDMSLVMSLVHRVAVMDFGRKIAEGTPSEVAAAPEVVSAYLGI